MLKLHQLVPQQKTFETILEALKTNIELLEQEGQELEVQDRQQILSVVNSEEFLSRLKTPSQDHSAITRRLYRRSLKVLGVSEKIIKIANVALEALKRTESKVPYQMEIASYLIETVLKEGFENKVLRDLNLNSSEVNVNNALTFAFLNKSKELVDVAIQSLKEQEFDEFVFSEGFYQGLTFAQAYLLTAFKHKKDLNHLKNIKLEQWLKPIAAKKWEEYTGYTPLLIALWLEIPIPYECLMGLIGRTDWGKILKFPPMPKHLENNPEFSEIKELAETHVLKKLSKSNSSESSDMLCLFFDLGHPIDRTFYKPYLWKKALLDGPMHHGLFQHLINQRIAYIPFYELVEGGHIEAILRLMMEEEFVFEDLQATLKEAKDDVQPVKVPMHNENRTKVLRALCEQGTTEYLDLFVLLVQGYYKDSFMVGFEDKELWDAALECHERPHVGLMQLLVEAGVLGAPPVEHWDEMHNWRDIENREAKYAALLKVGGKLDMVRTISSGDTQTPLSRAILQEDKTLVHCLLREDADPNISVFITREVLRPLDLALTKDEYGIAAELINYGASLATVETSSVSQGLSCLSYTLKCLISAYQDSNNPYLKQNPAILSKGHEALLFAIAVFKKTDPKVLNEPLKDGEHKGKTILQVLIEQGIWSGVEALGNLNVDVGSAFNSGPFTKMSALQAIFVRVCSGGIDLKVLKPHIMLTDGLSSKTLKDALKSLCAAANPEDFCCRIPQVKSYPAFANLTALHLALLTGVPLSIGPLQSIKHWPDLTFPNTSPFKTAEIDTALTLVIKRGASFPLISDYLSSGCPISDHCLSVLFEEIVRPKELKPKELKDPKKEQKHNQELRDLFNTLHQRGISLDRPLRNGKTILEHLSKLDSDEGFLSLVTAGATLTTQDMLIAAVQYVRGGLAFQYQSQNDFKNVLKSFPELERKQMSSRLFSWLSRKFPALALLFLENFVGNIQGRLPEQDPEFYDEANLRSIIQNSGSSLLLTRFLSACPAKALRNCGSLFPLAVSLIDFKETQDIITSVFSKVPPGPARISALFNALITRIGEDQLRVSFLNKEKLTDSPEDRILLAQRSEAYLVLRSQGFVLSRDHLERSLDHPLIAQPDPGWNTKICLPQGIGPSSSELDKHYSEAVKAEFLRLFDLIPIPISSPESLHERIKIREGLESSLNDLLNPEGSKTILADPNIEKRKKTYLLILHFLSHVIFSNKKAVVNEESLNLDNILSLAEAMPKCIPRRTIAASRAYGKEVDNLTQTYANEWIANMGTLRLNSIDTVVGRFASANADDNDQSVHTMTSIVTGLGKMLALPGYKSDKDKMQHFVHYLSVACMFFDIYSVDTIVYQTLADLKNPEIKSLYEKYWIDNPEQPWKEEWLEKNKATIKDLNAEIDKLLSSIANDKQEMQEVLLKIDDEIKELKRGLFTVYSEAEEQKLSTELKQQETARQRAVFAKLNKKNQERFKIQFATPAFNFASLLSDKQISLNSIAIQEVLDAKISHAEKKTQLRALVDNSCAKSALHEYLWEDFIDSTGEVVGSIPRAGPLYSTLEELGAFTRN